MLTQRNKHGVRIQAGGIKIVLRLALRALRHLYKCMNPAIIKLDIDRIGVNIFEGNSGTGESHLSPP
jgi:hypothetical protein